MAAKQPKTPWGKAFSAKFKDLKEVWDKRGTVNGQKVRKWDGEEGAFARIGATARKHADSKHANPIMGGRKKAAKSKSAKSKSKAKKPAAKKKPGRIFQALKNAVKPKARSAERGPGRAASSSSTVQLEIVKIAGGELVNNGSAATLRKDGSREVVSGGSWTPTARTIGKARKLREQLAGQGVRFSRITVLVDGRRQDRKRKGRARFSEGKLYLE